MHYDNHNAFEKVKRRNLIFALQVSLQSFVFIVPYELAKAR